MVDKVVTLRKTVAGTELYAKVAEYDSEGNEIASTYATATTLAADYDDTSTYKKGQDITYKGKYYRAKQDINAAEDFDSTHWDETPVGRSPITEFGDKTESDLVSGALTIQGCNSLTKLTLTSVNTLTVISNEGVPNFALEIDNTGNSVAVTITVVKSDGTTVMFNSAAGGTTVGAGKYAQLTAVGNCWTIAEFETPA